ncbi:MAG TPA: methyltransferase domain-containing protein [Pyrinomonadaceae bacterium]|nr:methyltransferase domain-containing protein [Pyrinomonadaceae bacterium]
MSAPRNLVKQLVPERLRLLRYSLYEKARYFPELVFNLGNRLECPFCGWHFRRFLPAGFQYPVIIEKQVIGGHWHRDNVCPRCKSNARERLAYLYLRDHTSLFHQPARVLHVAPEPQLAAVLKRLPNIRYFSADLMGPGVMSHFDIQQMPFADETFDVVICNHVMEHVNDDSVAMAAINRILKPGGWALLQVPIALKLDRTIEDPSAVTESQRIERFGQEDHVRLYTRRDYVRRLKAAGFSVRVESYPTVLGPAKVERFGLVQEEEVFLCSKVSPHSASEIES